ncbi:hypothetical protein CK501_06510 [Halovibrio salipaludis]|uniref:O-antigen ligase-related domain-containing protein n=1 Tax=Halovibrio salipaludis TaxID=2032626 RepID=A0A2A2F954_9GAMM|nr:O-antigen ligase family protein [Halovibrio salipaludis]PAU81207.1 hypothetical protein CK501_06510 [Halovibrio salipaludis]
MTAHYTSKASPVGIINPNRPRVTSITFFIYCWFLMDFFLRFPSRIPVYGDVRPTLLLVLCLSGLLFIQRDKFAGATRDPIMRTFMVLIGYLVLSLPLVEWPGSVVRHNLDDFVKAVVFLVFTVLVVDTEGRLKKAVTLFVGCQLFRVLEPLYLHFTQGYMGGETYLGGGEFAGRLAGAPADVINPNELGFVIVTVIPFLHYLLWTGRFTRKLLYLALMPLLLYALIQTMSRGAFIALLVVGWMIFRESSRKFMLILVAVAVAIAGWNSMSPIQKDRYLSLIDEDTQGAASAQGRIGGFFQELGLGLRRPVVGHGLGTTSEAKYHSHGSTKASHSLYAELFTEIGIIGAAIFLTFLYRIWRRLRINGQLLFEHPEAVTGYYANLNKALIAVFWMYAVYSINYYGLSQYYWYLFGGLVIVFARCVNGRIAKHQPSESANEPAPKAVYPLARKLSYRKG